MAIAPIREFTSLDQQRLNDSAKNFCKRHSIILENDPDFCEWTLLEFTLDKPYYQDSRQLSRLWQACKCRALNVKRSVSVTVGYGYVGYHVD